MTAALQLRLIADGLAFPEGPVALDDGSLLCVEIAAGTLRRITPDGRKAVLADLGGGPNGAALGPDGALYVCNNGGFTWHRDQHGLRPVAPAAGDPGGSIQRVDLDSGRWSVLYDRVDGRRLQGPNDIVFDRSGGFWFTEFGKSRPAQRTRDLGSVCYARIDGSFIAEVLYPILTPNGIGLSPDERTLVVADTESARLWAYDIVLPGVVQKLGYPSPHGGRLLAACGDGVYQRFDSLALDAAGNVHVATLLHAGITVVSPAGAVLAHRPLPDLLPTNICFGGADMRTAYITLSAGGTVVAAQWPEAGLRLNHQR